MEISQLYVLWVVSFEKEIRFLPQFPTQVLPLGKVPCAHCWGDQADLKSSFETSWKTSSEWKSVWQAWLIQQSKATSLLASTVLDSPCTYAALYNMVPSFLINFEQISHFKRNLGEAPAGGNLLRCKTLEMQSLLILEAGNFKTGFKLSLDYH